MSNPLVDKRVNMRVQCRDPVAAHAIGRSTERRVRPMLGADLSERGVRLSSPEMLAVNTRLSLSIEPQPWGEPIRVSGNVRWVVQTKSPNR